MESPDPADVNDLSRWENEVRGFVSAGLGHSEITFNVLFSAVSLLKGRPARPAAKGCQSSRDGADTQPSAAHNSQPASEEEARPFQRNDGTDRRAKDSLSPLSLLCRPGRLHTV